MPPTPDVFWPKLTSLTKPIEKKEKWKKKIGSSQENLCENLCARFQGLTYRLQSLPQNRLENWPWSPACESLEQQQDSGPSHAKPPPQKLSKRRLRKPLKRKKNETKRLAPARKTFAKIAKTFARTSRSRHIAYKACLKIVSKSDLCHAKPPPQKLSKRRLRNPLKRKKNERKRLAPARKTFAHASRGRHIAYTKLASKSSRNLALEYRLRKPRTAARFGPKPCETATTKTLETSLTKPIKKKNETKRLAPARNTFAKTFAHASRSRHIAYKACLKSVSTSEYCLRKPRTAARFGPKPCETATTKTLETSLTKPMKKKEKWMKGKDWPQQGKPLRTLPGADISPTKLASKSSRNLALEHRLRKPRTAARFGPKPCETATTKTLETSLTKPIKKKEKWNEKIGSSQEHLCENLGARFQEPTYRLQSLPQKRLEIWPWSTACESLEQQQDSGPSHAKPPPQKLSKRRLRNPLKRKMKRKDWLQQGTPLRKPLRALPGADISPTKLASKASRPRSTACESLEQQQDSGPSHAKPPPQKLSKRRLRNLWKRKKNEWKEKIGPSKENLGARFQEPTYRLQSLPQKRLEIWPWSTACESLEQQQDSGPERKMKGKDWLQQGKPLRTLLGADISPIQSLPQNRLEIWP